MSPSSFQPTPRGGPSWLGDLTFPLWSGISLQPSAEHTNPLRDLLRAVYVRLHVYAMHVSGLKRSGAAVGPQINDILVHCNYTVDGMQKCVNR